MLIGFYIYFYLITVKSCDSLNKNNMLLHVILFKHTSYALHPQSFLWLLSIGTYVRIYANEQTHIPHEIKIS